MSELDDFLADGLGAFLEVSGEVEFLIDAHRLSGDYNESSAERELGDDGPPVGIYGATILAPLAQFAGKFADPLERTLAEKRVTVKGRNLRIARATVDATSVLLTLENVNAAN